MMKKNGGRMAQLRNFSFRVTPKSRTMPHRPAVRRRLSARLPLWRRSVPWTVTTTSMIISVCGAITTSTSSSVSMRTAPLNSSALRATSWIFPRWTPTPACTLTSAAEPEQPRAASVEACTGTAPCIFACCLICAEWMLHAAFKGQTSLHSVIAT